MAVLTIQGLTHAFGGPAVLDGAQLKLERGDRVALLGRNGEGKSTLLRIICGLIQPDDGAVHLEKLATIGSLAQEPPTSIEGSVYDVVTGGLGASRDALRAYHEAVEQVSEHPTETNLVLLERTQTALEAVDGWDAQLRVDTVISQLGLDGAAEFATLSGGWRRRVFLGRALAAKPDVLVIDEPTNHLDVEAIEWLETFLKRFEGALLFVTHDRAFLRNLATRIVELDRGQLTEYPANFDAYLERKAHDLDVEANKDALFDKKLALEEAWIRQGIKARRTRNEGRVRALLKLREARRQRRTRKGTAKIQLQKGGRSGAIVIKAENISFAYDSAQPLVDDLSLTLKQGNRVGLIGPNGVGKTTLLRLLLRGLDPQAGSVIHGTRLEIRYYDQLRDELVAERTVAETIVEKGDTVMIDGQPKHIIGYLRDFLFEAEQARSPVSVLSGGERNRLLLAKLFSMPANVLVLDEPTNDLDMETLEVLEERLLAFPGTVLLVSHDREFLNRVVTESLIFEGDGVITRVAGGYEAWDKIRTARRAKAEAERKAIARARQEKERKQVRAKRRPKFNPVQRAELEALPGRIEVLDAEHEAVFAETATEVVYRDKDRLAEANAKLEAINVELKACYERWEALEALQEELA